MLSNQTTPTHQHSHSLAKASPSDLQALLSGDILDSQEEAEAEEAEAEVVEVVEVEVVEVAEEEYQDNNQPVLKVTN